MANYKNIFSATINKSANNALISYFDGLDLIRQADLDRVKTLATWDMTHDTKNVLAQARSKKATASDFEAASRIKTLRPVVAEGAREKYNEACKEPRKAMREATLTLFGKKGSNQHKPFDRFYEAYTTYRRVYDSNFGSPEAREAIKATKTILKDCLGVTINNNSVAEKCARRIISAIGVKIATTTELRKGGKGNCGVTVFTEAQVKTLLIRVFGEILGLANEFENLELA